MEQHALQQWTNQIQDGKETLDKSLLVVDDNRIFCDRLARALSSRGFTARTAMSVSEALAAINAAWAVIGHRDRRGSLWALPDGTTVRRGTASRRPQSRTHARKAPLAHARRYAAEAAQEFA